MTDSSSSPEHPASPLAVFREERVSADDAWLSRLALRLVRNEADARDLAQETWLAALRKSAPDGELRRAWLTTTARRIAARLRGRRREDRLDGLDLEPVADRGPDRTVEEVDARRNLYAALSSMKELDQRVILWRWVDGLSYSEIARRMRITRQSATYRVNRAVDTLRAKLAEHHGGDSLISALAPLWLSLRPPRRLKALAVSLTCVATLTAIVVVLRSDGLFAAESTTNIPVAFGESVDAGHTATGTGTPVPASNDGIPSDVVSKGRTAVHSAVIVNDEAPDTSSPRSAVEVSGCFLINSEPPRQGWMVQLKPLDNGAVLTSPHQFDPPEPRVPGAGVRPVEAAGQYRVAGARVGTYELQLFTDPLGDLGMAALTRDVVLGGGLVRVDIDIRTGSLRIEGAVSGSYLAESYIAEGKFGAHSTAKDGVLVFSLLPPGNVTVRQFGDDFVEGPILVRTTVHEGEETVELLH